MTIPKSIAEEIYRIIDSFLVEAKDQHGNARSVERLNSDRHLAAGSILSLVNTARYEALHDAKERLLKEMPKEEQNASVSEYYSGFNACRSQSLEATDRVFTKLLEE